MKIAQKEAFSLVELLAVIAIVAILAVLVVPATTQVLRGLKLSKASEQIAQAIAGARLRAITDNERVLLVFFKKNDSFGKAAYITWQVLRRQPDGSLLPLHPAERLPEGLALTENGALSSLDELDSITLTAALGAGIPAGTPGRCIVFRPDGSTTLPIKSQDSNFAWFLTIVDDRLANDANLPANYAVVQFDPVSGETHIFRP